MGTAIVRGLVTAAVVAPQDILATDIDQRRLEAIAADPGAKTTTHIQTLAAASDVIVLAVKPQSMEGALRELSRYVKPSHLVISIAAGMSTAYIEKHLGGQTRVVRTMPNTPAMVRAGATALCRGSQATEEDMAFATRLFAALGTTVVVGEDLMDAVTAISGSGPAYFFYLAEKLAKAGVEQGLSDKDAAELVRQTFYGSATLLRESGRAPKELRARVTSKGGTTAAAVSVFDAASLDSIISRAVSAAVARSKELGT
jgi:pyrroline-5-carboxylate reductase